ncbi:MAG: GntR family transcriptional regulator [Planctomycetota bacterium]
MSDSLMEQVHRFLRQSIAQGELGQGEYLSTNELAKELGISRTPVRDAVNQLASEGLLELRGKAGAVVHRLTLSEYEDYLGLRQALEPFAAEEATRRISYDTLQRLRTACREMARLSRQALDEGFADEATCRALQQADETFHRSIHESSWNQKLCQVIEDTRLLTFKLAYPSNPTASGLGRTLYEHWRVYRALAAGDAPRARLWMERHIKRHAVDAQRMYRQHLEAVDLRAAPTRARLPVTRFFEHTNRKEEA